MQRFQRLAESLPHMVWTCRASDGACTYLSPQWASYTGIAVEAQLGFAWLDQLHPDDVAITKERWAAAVSTGGVLDTEFRIRRHDGAHRWFKTRAVRSESDDGLIWHGSNTDIQDLKDALSAVDAANAALAARVAERTAELQASNVRLSELAEGLTRAQHVLKTGSWNFDLRRNVVRWSDELFRIFGLPPGSEAVPYADSAKLFTPASWASLQAAVLAAARDGVSYELTLEIVRPDGSVGVAVARAEAVRDDAGVAHLVGTFQDVTERERTAAELRVSTERLRLAKEAAGLGIWEWNVRTDAIVWDDGMYSLYGVERAQFSGAAGAWRAALHPEDAAAVQAELGRALDHPTFDLQFRIIRGDGAVRHIRAFATVFRDEAGASRVIGVNQDVTEQRLAELALRNSDALQRAVLAHAGSAIIATDTRGAITLWNRAAEDMLGYRGDEVIGRYTPEIIHDPAEVEVRRAVAEHVLGRPVQDPFEVFIARAHVHGADASEWTYVRKDGSRLPVLLTTTVMKDANGSPVGYLGVAVDLTERKAAEDQLHRLNLLLEERSAQKEVLLQEVHHRVKNNLQVIASLMNMQLRKLDEPAARLALEECRARVQSIALIHEQLYTSGNYARIPLAEYAKQLSRNIVAATVDAGRISLAFDLTPVHLTVDKAIPCGLILNELVTNALKHAFPDARRGTIRIGLTSDERRVTLSVVDDGVGTAHAAANPRSLGLQLVSTLVRQLDGTLDVEHASGTAYRLSFPAPGA